MAWTPPAMGPRRQPTQAASGTSLPGTHPPGIQPGSRWAPYDAARQQQGAGRLGDTWYQQQYRSVYDQMRNKYGGQYDQLAQKAMALGNRDWTKESVDFAREDAARAEQAAQQRANSYGMGEIAMSKDWKENAVKRERDAVTRAQMDAQQMQRGAYETATGMVNAASGADLQALQQRLAALSSGAGDYQGLLQLLLPLMQQAGAAQYGIGRGRQGMGFPMGLPPGANPRNPFGTGGAAPAGVL